MVASNLEKPVVQITHTREFCQLPFSFMQYEWKWELVGEEMEFVEKLSFK